MNYNKNSSGSVGSVVKYVYCISQYFGVFPLLQIFSVVVCCQGISIAGQLIESVSPRF